MFLSRRLAVVAVAALAAPAARATILPFTSFGTGGVNAYGDRVVSPTQGGTTYLEGLGWTPNVTLDFVTLNGFGGVSLWSSGYASLSSALGHGSFNVPFRLGLVADPGWLVTLHGFDIATWLRTAYQRDIRIWDDNGRFGQPNLFALDSLLAAQTVYQPLTSSVTGVGTVRLYVSNLGSTGLDNISFSQSPIPEPASLSLLVPAAMLLRRRGR